MSSLYSVTVSKRVHVIRSESGFCNLISALQRIIGRAKGGFSEEMLFNELFEHFEAAKSRNARVVLSLEPRYRWAGWEQFQRVLVLDFSGGKKRGPAVSAGVSESVPFQGGSEGS